MKTRKEELQEAYEAGKKSVELNQDRDRRLDEGVKQIECEYNFYNWYFTKESMEDMKS